MKGIVVAGAVLVTEVYQFVVIAQMTDTHINKKTHTHKHANTNTHKHTHTHTHVR